MDKRLIAMYLEEAKRIAGRSDCLSRKVGAVIGDTTRYKVCGSGWNASPLQSAGLGCRDMGVCAKRSAGYGSGEGHEKCLAIHAEVHALLNLFSNKDCSIEPWFPFRDKALFVTHLPCSNCAKVLIQCGIKDVYYSESYPDEESISMFKKYDVNLHKPPETADDELVQRLEGSFKKVVEGCMKKASDRDRTGEENPIAEIFNQELKKLSDRY